MSLESIRETVSTLRESREAIHDGRIAIEEANADLHARYGRAKRRIERVDRAIDVLRRDGADADLRELLDTLDGDVGMIEIPIGPR